MVRRSFWLLIAGGLLMALLTRLTACGNGSLEQSPPLDQDDAGQVADSQIAGAETPQFSPVALGPGEKLQVVATTSIVADVVEHVGGELIELVTLLPLGADPHAFEPTPQDVAAVAEAHVVFANGVGLEAFLEPLLESAGASNRVVHVSDGVKLLQPTGAEVDRDEKQGVSGQDNVHPRGDPHTWTDPENVKVWVQNIEAALGKLDPAHADEYATESGAYDAVLDELDRWIREQVSRIPEGSRRLVTDHTMFAYLAEAYGFTQVGAIFPGFSTLSEPSAKELAALEDAVRDLDVKAVFVGLTVNASLAERVTEDTRTKLIRLYTGSLSEKDGPAGTYVDYMRYNVNTIVDALK
jgi:manganese/iron transport system substrate-binding protein